MINVNVLPSVILLEDFLDQYFPESENIEIMSLSGHGTDEGNSFQTIMNIDGEVAILEGYTYIDEFLVSEDEIEKFEFAKRLCESAKRLCESADLLKELIEEALQDALDELFSEGIDNQT